MLNTCQALIEIPKGSTIKYEWDFESKILHAKRSLPAHYSFPTNYGFIPKTIAPDGDELDIFVFASAALIVPTIVTVQVVGVLEMKDKGVRDDKVIALMSDDKNWSLRSDVLLWPSKILDDLHVFYREVKKLEGKPFEFLGFKGTQDAMTLIKNCFLQFEEKKIRN